MTEAATNIPPARLPSYSEGQPPKKKPSVIKRITRWIISSLLVLLILIALLIGFTQTSWFRSIVASQLSTLVADETNGILSIERIEGNFVTGFTLHNVRLRLRDSSDTTDIIRVGEVYTRYSLIGLLRSDAIPVRAVVLRSPDITFRKRAGDSVWNYEKLFLPSEQTAETSAPFITEIILTRFRIEGGRLRVEDENTPSIVSSRAGRNKRVDFSHLDVDSLDLDMSAHVWGETKQNIRINNVSFIERNSGMQFRHLEFTAIREDANISLEGLHLVTEKTAIRLQAQMKPVAVMQGHPLDSLEHSYTKLSLEADAISTDELEQFLPQLDFLGGTPSIVLDAEGEFGEMEIRYGELGLREGSGASFKGKVMNLHKPTDIAFIIDFEGRKLGDVSLRTYIPGIAIGDMSRYGIVNIPRLHYEGTPLNFHSNFDIQTTNGDVEGKASFDMRRQHPEYVVDIVSKNINLAAFTEDSTYRGNTSVKLYLKGKGFDPKTAEAEFSLTSQESFSFWKMNFTKMDIQGELSRGILTSDNVSFDLAEGTTLRSEYAIVDFNGEKPTYEVSVIANDIYPSKYLENFPDSSIVSITANVAGAGANLDSLVGSIDATVENLQYHGLHLEPVKINAVFDRPEGGKRSDRITSSIADLSLTGHYTLEGLFESIARRASAVIADFYRSEVRESQTLLVAEPDSLEMAFNLNMKDLRPLEPFMDSMVIIGEGRVRGFLEKHRDGTMDLDASGDIARFVFRSNTGAGSDDTSGGTSFRVFDSLLFVLEADNVSSNPETALDSLHALLTVSSDSTIRFNNTLIAEPNASIMYGEGALSYSASARIPDVVRAMVKGRGDLTAETYTFPLDSLMLDFGQGFEWYSERPPVIVLNSSGLMKMDTLSLYRPELGYDPEMLLAQRMKFGFEIKGDSIRHAFFEAPQLKLKDLPLFFTSGARTQSTAELTGRVSNLKVHAAGALANPRFEASLLVRNFMYEGVTLDSCKADLVYDNYTLRGTADLHVDTTAYSIESARSGKIVLHLPSDNGFHVVIDSLPLMMDIATNADFVAAKRRMPSRRQSIRVYGTKFPLDVFSNLLPAVSQAHGLIDAELRVGGTTDSIQLRGDATITHGSFLVPTTNIFYDFDGNMSLNGNTITFEKLTVRNKVSDDQNGIADVTGMLRFDGFNVKSFNFTARTNRLLVLSEESRSTMKRVYGPLAIRTGVRPIVLSGDLNSPELSGDVTILQAYLTFPQNVATSSLDASRDIIFIDVNQPKPDTQKINLDSLLAYSPISERNYDHADDMGANDDASDEGMASKTAESGELSFQDKLAYDVNLNMPGNTWINVFFNRAKGVSGEQLTAEVRSDGEVQITRSKQGGQLNFSGRVLLTQQSTYKFLGREFSPVYGKLIFVSDPFNPDLDLHAEYVSQASGTDDYYKIILNITGTPDFPDLAMELYKRNPFGGYERIIKPQDELNTDILVFLTTNTFPNALSSADALNSAVMIGSAMPTQLANVVADRILGSVGLKQYVRNINFELGENIDKSKLKLTAGVGDLNVHYTRNSLTNANQDDFTVELPFSMLFEGSQARNMSLKFHRHTYDQLTLKSPIIPPNYSAGYEWRFPIGGSGKTNSPLPERKPEEKKDTLKKEILKKDTLSKE